MEKKAQKRTGSLSFEWIVITTLLVIGLISGLGALRNAVVDKLGDLTESVEELNSSSSTQNTTSGGTHMNSGLWI